MSDKRKLWTKKILIIAALISIVVSAAYACPDIGYPTSY